jgi:CRP-like cAMP-binding protein
MMAARGGLTLVKTALEHSQSDFRGSVQYISLLLVRVSRETITRIRSDFKQKEMIEPAGSTLIIHNKRALEQLVTA